MAGLPFTHDDGGRADAGFRGTTGDCVTRAIAIASGIEYADVYAALYERASADERWMRRKYGDTWRRHTTPRSGMFRRHYEPFLFDHGFRWTPTMAIGSGCTTHLRPGELPDGRLVVAVSKHITAVIDGVVHDLYDPCRDGDRCVYGFYRYEPKGW